MKSKISIAFISQFSLGSFSSLLFDQTEFQSLKQQWGCQLKNNQTAISVDVFSVLLGFLYVAFYWRTSKNQNSIRAVLVSPNVSFYLIYKTLFVMIKTNRKI